MKTIFAASLGAMMVAGSLAAYAGTVQSTGDPTQEAVVTLSTPYTAGNNGSANMPVFLYKHAVPVQAHTIVDPLAKTSSQAADPPGDPPADPPAAVSTSNGGQAMPTFSYDHAVPTGSSVNSHATSRIFEQNGPESLLNHRGGGR